MSKPLRPHRFPPLSQFTQLSGHGQALVPAGGRMPSEHAQLQSSMAEGFQQGLDKGYEEGWDAGRERGHRDGLSAGYQEGQQQGRSAGHQEALAKFEGLARPLEAALADLQRLQADYQAALRKEVVDLVAKVARQVVRCELTLQPTQLLALVDEALSVMPPSADGIEIFMHPEERQRILELAPERTAGWTLLADPGLQLGECRVKVGDREADAGCQQRLHAVMEQVHHQLLEQPDMDMDTAQAEALTP
ncbi:MAG: flagellar assembly protein H [Proteobacteria bacterium]|uniref:flagellar assembly protein FliH n=1 Tax=Aquabacterium sp. TaxID=1872578 RepID=UPI0035C67B5A|nr:flagellar assembly protein H [Pseudomonadota bacterium]